MVYEIHTDLIFSQVTSFFIMEFFFSGRVV